MSQQFDHIDLQLVAESKTAAQLALGTKHCTHILADMAACTRVAVAHKLAHTCADAVVQVRRTEKQQQHQ